VQKLRLQGGAEAELLAVGFVVVVVFVVAEPGHWLSPLQASQCYRLVSHFGG